MQRVVSLEWQQTEDLLALGVTPVGVADTKGYRTWVKAAPLPAKVQDVGTRTEPNTDAIMATNPDLIVLEANRGDDKIARLEKFDVPVLVTTGADTKDPLAKMTATLELLGKATGTEAKARQAAADVDEAIADAKARITAAAPANRKFVYADAYVDGSNVAIRPFGQGSLVGEIGEAVGLKNAWTGKVDAQYGLGQTDVEGLTATQDVHLFYTSTDADEWLPKLRSNALWKNADFTKKESIHPFGTGVWTFGGPKSAAQVADQFATILEEKAS